MHQVKIEQFQGPLALLLDLIEQDKLDITQVSLSEVAEQYWQRVQELESTVSTAELADFLVIAGKLLVLKSRLLLPPVAGEAEDEARDLEEQLKIYKIYLQAGRALRNRIAEKRFAFTHPPERGVVRFLPPKKLLPAELARAAHSLIANLSRTFTVLPKAALKKVVSLQEKIQSLRALLARAPQITFRDLMTTAERSEAVVSFLALLELMKRRELVAIQEAEEIVISRYD